MHRPEKNRRAHMDFESKSIVWLQGVLSIRGQKTVIKQASADGTIIARANE